ncbi:MAG: phosphoribosylformimino-5-aminoimidazole carboxamide ribotide isomerase [Desulfatitalea sp.]|nr:phosphoribosylformimino-5-aminoimidazole carboxamide ribotide isomerase [Desulfatitalea sp.]
MKFRPCIDLHQGRVKQIVGGTLSDADPDAVQTNFEASRPAEWFAQLYRKDGLTGGHIIQLGPGNQAAAEAALGAWPGGMQLGGGVTLESAAAWLAAGASAVIVTSWVFHDGTLDEDRLTRLSQRIGPERLVLDLSCRRRGDDYFIVTNRWQTFTQERITHRLLDRLAPHCAEYLIHAVDVEGKCQGIELPLVTLLGEWVGLPITYAGGIYSQEDIDAIERLGQGRIDFTVGSALDIFGGNGLIYQELARRYGPNASKP